jgi:transposase-like protein
MSMRAAPFYCPYCGEESLEPWGDKSGFYCSSCDRRFELSFKGLGEG